MGETDIRRESMKKFQMGIIVVLAMMLMVTPVFANGATINLSGNIYPATIDVGLDKSQMILDIAAGDSTANDTITITNTSLIPIKVRLESVSHNEESWSPTMITADPTTLGLVDGQNQARFTLGALVGDVSGDPGVIKAAPVGTGTLQLTATADGTTWGDAGTTPILIGTITESADGVTEEVATTTGTLDVSKKRILSKVFDTEMVLNFAAE